MDDLREIEAQARELARRVDALRDGRPDGAVAFVAKTIKVGSTYPTAAKAWYGFAIQDVTGSEAEGTVPGLAAADNTPTGFAYNVLGTAVPPEGTAVIVSSAGNGRFVFSY